jgi:SAM-dependent methyltransferase
MESTSGGATVTQSTTSQSYGGPYERLYATTPSLWQGHVGEMVQFFCGNFPMPDKIGQMPANAIDLGGGEGDNAIYLAERGYSVHLVELSPTAIERFINRRNTLSKKLQHRLTHECKSVNAQTLDSKYDVIVSYGLLHCFPTSEDAAQVARACVSALTPGGYFIVSSLTNGVPTDEYAHPELTSCHLPSVVELNEWFHILKPIKVEVESIKEAHGNGRSHHHEVFRGVFQTI